MEVLRKLDKLRFVNFCCIDEIGAYARRANIISVNIHTRTLACTAVYRKVKILKEMPKHRNVVLLTLASVGLIYVVVRNRKRIYNRLKRTLDFRNALRHQRIEVVTTTGRCREVVAELKRDCQHYKVLGFDCEWVTVGGSRRPIALVQLASPSGLCGLFRLNCLRNVPAELREILHDDDILKVGVVPQDDALALAKDYGVVVASTLDLRHLAARANRKPLGLSKMSKDLLNVEMDKDWRVSSSDWESPELTERQLKYAADDAHVAIEIFKVLTNELVPRTFFQSKQKQWTDISNLCGSYIDMKFGNQGESRKEKKRRVAEDKKKSLQDLHTRSRALYDNCFLKAPDGELLCTCDRKKLDWYIAKNLGTRVSTDPYTVRLNFEPAVRNLGDMGKFYQVAKENKCVVCGRSDSYIRKNIVPREYSKHFPTTMKSSSHTSHDVLLLCPNCHQESSMSDLAVRHKLAEMCDAPLPTSPMKSKEVAELRQLRSAARALLYNADNVPEDKKEILRKIVLKNYPNEVEITDELLREVAEIDILDKDGDYLSHGEKVVKKLKNLPGGLIELEKVWRRHFVDTMHPRYLPEFWSVDHNNAANR